MSFPGAPVLLALYYSVLVVLAFYGIHRFLLAMLYLKTRSRRLKRPPDPEDWPVVTVQLPLYNEMYVAERLIDAVCRLDYPPERLEIQVLDDSTDETVE
ncbi:MAG TPA: glycosyl transferase family 2, partial [Thermoanaerobaculia bacterium]